MTHTRMSIRWRRLFAWLHPLVPKAPPPGRDQLHADLPQGLPDHLLRDIGLSGQQAYLYRHKTRDPGPF